MIRIKEGTAAGVPRLRSGDSQRERRTLNSGTVGWTTILRTNGCAKKYVRQASGWIRQTFCTLAVMQQRSTGTVTRSLLLLLLPVIALLAVPPLGSSGSAAVLGTAIAVFVVAALATSSKYELLQLCAVSATGPSDDERCLRGAFRRQSSPDAPGRPQPRAPGIGL